METASDTVGNLDGQVEAPTASDIIANYETVLDKDAFNAWLEKIQTAELTAFDTETTSLNYMAAELVGVSFSVEAGVAAYVPFAHDYEGAPEQLDRAWVLEQLKPWLEDDSKAKVGQHLKYDANVLNNYDITLRGIAYDTMLESYVYNSVSSRHDMDTLAKKFLNHTCVSLKNWQAKAKSKRPSTKLT